MPLHPSRACSRTYAQDAKGGIGPMSHHALLFRPFPTVIPWERNAPRKSCMRFEIHSNYWALLFFFVPMLPATQYQDDFNDLYWNAGDGGPSGDSIGASQNTDNLLGSMMRISVPTVEGYVSPAGLPYEIPAGNYQGMCARCISQLRYIPQQAIRFSITAPPFADIFGQRPRLTENRIPLVV